MAVFCGHATPNDPSRTLPAIHALNGAKFFVAGALFATGRARAEHRRTTRWASSRWRSPCHAGAGSVVALLQAGRVLAATHPRTVVPFMALVCGCGGQPVAAFALRRCWR